VVVTLEMPDILEVEEICLDEDGGAALRFVRERVKPQIDAARKSGCDPQFGLHGPDRPPAGSEGRT
jgi:hypothetical protein